MWYLYKIWARRRNPEPADPYTLPPAHNQHRHSVSSRRRSSHNPQMQTQQCYPSPPPTFRTAMLDVPPNYPRSSNPSSTSLAPNDAAATVPYSAADPNYHLLDPNAPPLQSSAPPTAGTVVTSATQPAHVQRPPVTFDMGSSVGPNGPRTSPMLLEPPSPAHTREFRSVGSPVAVPVPVQSIESIPVAGSGQPTQLVQSGSIDSHHSGDSNDSRSSGSSLSRSTSPSSSSSSKIWMTCAD